jgi:hypothetical protein
VPDVELVDALHELGVPQLEAQGCLTEAAVAWRLGRRGLARSLAQRAAGEWRHAGLRWPAALAESLALVCGADPAGPDASAEGIEDCPAPGIAVQVLGLAARARRESAVDVRAAARRLAERLPVEQWSRRREVLSVDEVLVAVATGSAGEATEGER